MMVNTQGVNSLMLWKNRALSLPHRRGLQQRRSRSQTPISSKTQKISAIPTFLLVMMMTLQFTPSLSTVILLLERERKLFRTSASMHHKSLLSNFFLK
jgi:hypothetical protein